MLVEKEQKGIEDNYIYKITTKNMNNRMKTLNINNDIYIT